MTATVYLSGPIEGCNVVQRDSWRGLAQDLAPEFDWLDPCRHNADGFYDGKELPDELILFDKEDIVKSNAVLCNPWKKSEGTAMEVMYAYSNNIPVITVWDKEEQGQVNLWIRYHSLLIVPTLKQAIQYIRDNMTVTTVAQLRNPEKKDELSSSKPNAI